MGSGEMRAGASYPRRETESGRISGRRVGGGVTSAKGINELNHPPQPFNVEEVGDVSGRARRRLLLGEVGCLEGNGRMAAVG
jgi:hypothetical protein